MTKQYRYPGVSPFSKEQASLFFGRSEDIQNLAELMSRHQQVLLYSKSGLGKSSLINAGLLPLLEQRGEFEPIQVRFGSYSPGQERSPVDAVIEALKQSKTKFDYSLLDKILPEGQSIWYHCKARHLAGGSPLLLLFDQFEELFSYPPEDILRFKKQMADLYYRVLPNSYRKALTRALKLENISEEESRKLNQALELRSLTAIREDRYSLLNGLIDYLPDCMQNRYALGPLKAKQAEEAIVEPAKQKGKNYVFAPFSYGTEALAEIMRFLTKGGTQAVETTQLQILCNRIELLDLRSVGIGDIPAFDDIFLEYYQGCLDKLPEASRREIQVFIETKLVQKEQRLSLDSRIFPDVFSNGVIQILVREQHLLRAELNSTGAISYEVSHDTLIAPIVQAKQSREAREAAEAAKAEAKKQAEEEAERNRQLQERLQKEAQAKAEQRKQLLITRGLLALALLAGAWAFYAQKQAENAKGELAEKNQALEKTLYISDSLKTEAEELLLKYGIEREAKEQALDEKGQVIEVLDETQKDLGQTKENLGKAEKLSDEAQLKVNILAQYRIENELNRINPLLALNVHIADRASFRKAFEELDAERAKMRAVAGYEPLELAQLDAKIKKAKDKCNCFEETKNERNLRVAQEVEAELNAILAEFEAASSEEEKTQLKTRFEAAEKKVQSIELSFSFGRGKLRELTKKLDATRQTCGF